MDVSCDAARRGENGPTSPKYPKPQLLSPGQFESDSLSSCDDGERETNDSQFDDDENDQETPDMEPVHAKTIAHRNEQRRDSLREEMDENVVDRNFTGVAARFAGGNDRGYCLGLEELLSYSDYVDSRRHFVYRGTASEEKDTDTGNGPRKGGSGGEPNANTEKF